MIFLQVSYKEKAVSYWLMKSEPLSYSIADLKRDKQAFWDGVRNYQARNFMIQDMKLRDKVLFYHSNAKPSGVTGLAEVCKTASPDKTALDKKSKYYDPKATLQKPIWQAVTLQFVKQFDRCISLSELREKKPLQDMWLLRKGQRLSVMPLKKQEYDYIVKMQKN